MSKAAVILAVVGAIVVHGIVLLFGGIIFLGEETHASKRDVELVSEDVQKDKEETVKEEEKQEVKQETEAPPDPNQSIKSVDVPSQSSDDAPALDAASLSAIEAALNGGGVAGGDFGAGAASLATGGRIGGTGKGGGEEQASEEAFSMSEIDQRPRPIQQVAGAFPQEMRSKSVEGRGDPDLHRGRDRARGEPARREVVPPRIRGPRARGAAAVEVRARRQERQARELPHARPHEVPAKVTPCNRCTA